MRKRKRIKYTSVEDGALVPVTAKPERKTRIACCDCSLVHTHRIILRVDKLGNQRVYLQSWRDNKETARLRRNDGIRFRKMDK